MDTSAYGHFNAGYESQPWVRRIQQKYPRVEIDRTCSMGYQWAMGYHGRVAVISAKNHKRQRRKRQSVTAKREKSQTPKVSTAILALPNLT